MSGKGWFSSAISGLESRLDTILADDEQASAKSRAAEAAAKQETAGKVAGDQKLAVETASRNPSRSRPSSRLQDRLNKAVNKGTEKAESRASSDLGSRSDGPSLRNPAVTAVSDAGRASTESKRSDQDGASVVAEQVGLEAPQKEVEAVADTASGSGSSDAAAVPPTALTPSVPLTSPTATIVNEEPPSIPVLTMSVPTIRASSSPSPRSSLEAAPSRNSTDASAPVETIHAGPRDSAELEAALALLQTTYETALRENREEVNGHLERIDALQSKLTYLSQQLAASSKEAASDAEAVPEAKKLAEKDAQIVALMEEGQKLSKNEMKQSTMVKKLRSRVQDQDKEITTLKQRLANTEKELSEQTERAKRLESAERAAQEKLKIVGQIEKDIDVIKNEREEAKTMIQDLRKQLADALSRGDEAQKKAQSGALEAEKRIALSLREDIESMRIEKKLAEDRAKREVQAARDEARSQQDRVKVTELELRGEITNLESKLELLRTRTEEASSSAKGDSQATLLRQVETLQTQYSLASENWQGIETSLTSRVLALEKERDEMAKRESDVRRRAREVNTKARRLEDDLENVAERARGFEHDLNEQRAAAQKLQTKLEQVESAAKESRSDLDEARKTWEAELQQRLEDERTKWQSEAQSLGLSGDFNHPRNGSFSASQRRHSPDPLGIHSKRLPRSISGVSDMPLSPMDRMFDDQVRRPTSSRHKPPKTRTPDLSLPQRQDSMSSNMANLNGGGMPETPSIFANDHDDPFDNISSPHRTINDMISVSTVGAGPSVQLVERMSAAVRRLESEKATSKEEMSRLSAQRDEAREEVVALMREVEEKRAQDEKVEQLEKRLNEVDERYQTTLEMLGEKTERVEELEGDVLDLKKMYRELVQTMK